MTGCYEHCNEHSGSIKAEGFFLLASLEGLCALELLTE
jgi:hypothetical protein